MGRSRVRGRCARNVLLRLRSGAWSPGASSSSRVGTRARSHPSHHHRGGRRSLAHRVAPLLKPPASPLTDPPMKLSPARRWLQRLGPVDAGGDLTSAVMVNPPFSPHLYTATGAPRQPARALSRPRSSPPAMKVRTPFIADDHGRSDAAGHGLVDFGRRTRARAGIGAIVLFRSSRRPASGPSKPAEGCGAPTARRPKTVPGIGRE